MLTFRLTFYALDATRLRGRPRRGGRGRAPSCSSRRPAAFPPQKNAGAAAPKHGLAAGGEPDDGRRAVPRRRLRPPAETPRILGEIGRRHCGGEGADVAEQYPEERRKICIAGIEPVQMLFQVTTTFRRRPAAPWRPPQPRSRAPPIHHRRIDRHPHHRDRPPPPHAAQHLTSSHCRWPDPRFEGPRRPPARQRLRTTENELVMPRRGDRGVVLGARLGLLIDVLTSSSSTMGVSAAKLMVEAAGRAGTT